MTNDALIQFVRALKAKTRERKQAQRELKFHPIDYIEYFRRCGVLGGKRSSTHD